MFKKLKILLATIMLFVGSVSTAADPVKIIIPFAPGGGTDSVARIIAGKMSAVSGLSVVTENRPGASGSIASREVSRSVPDANTLMIITVTTHAATPIVIKDLPFDILKDFTHIKYIGHSNMIVAVNSTLPIYTIQDLIDYSKKNHLTYGSSGKGSTEHFSGEQFKQISGARIDHIPYKGSSLMTHDLIGGHISMTFGVYPTLIAHIRNKVLRPLAVITDQRLSDLPNVPTLKELGYDIVTPTWYGLSGPRGITNEKAKWFNHEVDQVLRLPDVQERMKQLGIDVAPPMTPEQFTDFIKYENLRLRRIAEKSAIKPD